MKALSLWQPWASLVAFGEKKIETRPWSTQYCGLLAIHAAKRLEREQAFLLAQEPFRTALHRNGVFLPSEMVRGAIIAICLLTRCERITPEFAQSLSRQEIAFGDFTPGRYAWILRNVVALPEPVICPGHQRLWYWSERIIGPNPNMVRETIELVRNMAKNGEKRQI